MTGRSGSGKTCNFKKAMAYLAETTQPAIGSQFTSMCTNIIIVDVFLTPPPAVVSGQAVRRGLSPGELLQHKDVSQHPRHQDGAGRRIRDL